MRTLAMILDQYTENDSGIGEGIGNLSCPCVVKRAAIMQTAIASAGTNIPCSFRNQSTSPEETIADKLISNIHVAPQGKDKTFNGPPPSAAFAALLASCSLSEHATIELATGSLTTIPYNA